MYQSEKRFEQRDREKKILRFIDGIILALSFMAYIGFSMFMAGIFSSAGLFSTFLLSSIVTFSVVGFVVLLMLCVYVPDEFTRFSYFLFQESFRNGLIEYAPEQNEEDV